MYAITRKIVALGLTCCFSGAIVAESLPPQIEQVRKALIAEKEQWVYVHKVLGTSGLQPTMDKMHAWMRKYPTVAEGLAVISGFAAASLMALFLDKIAKSLENRENAALQQHLIGERILCIVDMFAIVSAVVIAGCGTWACLDAWLGKEPSVVIPLPGDLWRISRTTPSP